MRFDCNRLDIVAVAGVGVICLFPAMLGLWYFIDHSWPYWDGASHVIDAIKYQELLSHPSVFKIEWWRKFLTVNYCYSPVLHSLYGLFKVLLGSGLLVEKVFAVIYCLILSAASYLISWRIFRSRLSSALTVVVVNTLPIVMQYSHSTYLDFAFLSLCSLCLLTLSWWLEKVCWFRTIALGIILGIGVSSKQVASYFLILPCLYLAVLFLKNRDFRSFRHLSLAGLVACLFLAVWIIPNYNAIIEFTRRPRVVSGNPNFLEILHTNLCGYLLQLPESVSPLLLLPALVALVSLPWTFHRIEKRNRDYFWLILLSASGLLFLLHIAYNNPEIRYAMPIFLFVSILTGNVLRDLVDSKFIAVKAFGVSYIALILFQYLYYCFTPYPLTIPQSLAQIGASISAKPYRKFSYLPNKNPTPGDDLWRQVWMLEQIKQADGGAISYLLVVPNEPRYNVHTMNLISLLRNQRTQATTLRTWTANGDEIEFDESKLDYFRWYLLLDSSKPQTYREFYPQEIPKDEASFKALELQKSAIKRRAQLFASERLVDGTTLQLYRQKN